MTPPQAGGSLEFLTVDGLHPCTPYYMALKTRDGVANWSGVSNVGQFRTVCGGGAGGGMRAQQASPSPALASSARDEATSLGLSAILGAALAAEMQIQSGATVWTLYHLSAEASASLGATDSASIVIQTPNGAGAWLTRTRLRPSSSTFGLRSGRMARRVVFLGNFGLALVSRTVTAEAAGSGQALELVEARHSRLGDVQTAVTSTDGNDVGLSLGDTLTLRYAGSASPVVDAQDEFLWVGPGSASQLVGRRPLREETPARSMAFALRASEPSPFARQTVVRFEVPRPVTVRLEVFDLLGRRVRTLAAGEFSAGAHQLDWDGSDDAGIRLPAGVYHLRMNAEEFSARRTVAMLP